MKFVDSLKKKFTTRLLPKIIRFIMAIKKEDIPETVFHLYFKIYKTPDLLCIGKKRGEWKFAIYNKRMRFVQLKYERKPLIAVENWKIDSLKKRILFKQEKRR